MTLTMALNILLYSILIVILLIAGLSVRRFYVKRRKKSEVEAQKKSYYWLEQLLSGGYSEDRVLQELNKDKHIKKMLLFSVLFFSSILVYRKTPYSYPVQSLLKKSGEIAKLRAMLNKRAPWKKAYALNAISRLELSGFEERAAKLLKHKDEQIRYLAADYLINMECWEYLPKIIQILSPVDEWFLEGYATVLARHQEDTVEKLLYIYNSSTTTEEEKLCISRIVKGFDLTKSDLFFREVLSSAQSPLSREVAAEYMLEKDPVFLAKGYFENDIRPYIRALSIRSLSSSSYKEEYVDRLLSHAGDDFEVIRKAAISTLVEMTNKKPEIQDKLEKLLITTELYDEPICRVFRVLDLVANVIRDLVDKEKSHDSEIIIGKLINNGALPDVLQYIAASRNEEIKNILYQILAQKASKRELYTYSHILKKMPEKDYQRLVQLLPMEEGEEKVKVKEKKIFYRLALTVLLFLITVMPAIIINNRYGGLWQEDGLMALLAVLVLEYNKLIIYYVASINSFYLLLFFFSFLGIKNYEGRSRVWRLSNIIQGKKVPPVSIIAPSYNESATIIESVNTLLNIRYPKFEIVVVNDGSKDDTLEKLIYYYNLEKTVPIYREIIPTGEVRNVYTSREVQNLLVVDKENGGKADALNAGINIANNPYFCAIDADTLIDGYALQDVAGPFFYQHQKAVATGGNIRVVNDCKVDHGVIEEKKLPQKGIEVLQVLEYIRAFVGGRVGWSYFNSLLIISGAFGLFKKKAAFGIGGYKTKKSRDDDTVGEDMELVVSYHKYMRKEKKPYRITFCSDAGGWTEVPSTVGILKKQRNRWQRGLIEVLSDNYTMFLNPRYGITGLVAYPYFIIFEFLGPWFEVMGYLSVLLAFLLGLISHSIFILLFTVSVVYGMILTLLCLYLDEYREIRYSNKEFFRLILYSFFENLIYRQLNAFWRVGGYIHLIFNKGGWGEQKRKGFNQSVKKIVSG